MARGWLITIAISVAVINCIINLDEKGIVLISEISTGKTVVSNVTTSSIPQPVTPADSVIDYSDIPVEKQVPKLVVAGAQKGGTTAVSRILAQQEQFRQHAPRCRQSPELHFFDKRIYVPKGKGTLRMQNITAEEWDYFLQNPQQGLTDKVVEALRIDYLYCWNLEDQEHQNQVIAMEKTPIYMIQPGLPALLKKVAPWAKVLFVIREPVARAFSSWKMDHRKGYFKEPFEHYIDLEINYLREQGLSNAPTLDEFSKPGFVMDPSAFQLPNKRGSEKRKTRIRR